MQVTKPLMNTESESWECQLLKMSPAKELYIIFLMQMEGNINSIEEGTSNLSEMVDQCCCPEQEDQSITNSLIRMVDMYMQRKSLNFIKFQIAVYIHYPF